MSEKTMITNEGLKKAFLKANEIYNQHPENYFDSNAWDWVSVAINKVSYHMDVYEPISFEEYQFELYTALIECKEDYDSSGLYGGRVMWLFNIVNKILLEENNDE